MGVSRWSKTDNSLKLTFLHRTWVLTAEDVVDPPKRLAEGCQKSNIDKDAFGTCNIGETQFF